MDDRFDREFYKSEWQRVLPLGPNGIQPYVRASRPSRLPALRAGLGRLIAISGRVAQSVIRFGRFAAIGAAKRPMPSAGAPRVQRPLRRLAQEVARPGEQRAAARQRLSRAA